MNTYSLQYEIIRHYQAIYLLLAKLPATRRAHFVVGTFRMEKFELSTSHVVNDSKMGVRSYARLKKGKPELVSPDGETLVNLWYIPHFSEVLRGCGYGVGLESVTAFTSTNYTYCIMLAK